jgi:hypothetical protein
VDLRVWSETMTSEQYAHGWWDAETVADRVRALAGGQDIEPKSSTKTSASSTARLSVTSTASTGTHATPPDRAVVPPSDAELAGRLNALRVSAGDSVAALPSGRAQRTCDLGDRVCTRLRSCAGDDVHRRLRTFAHDKVETRSPAYAFGEIPPTTSSSATTMRRTRPGATISSALAFGDLAGTAAADE